MIVPAAPLQRLIHLQFLAKLATNLAKPKGVRVLCHRDVPCVLASTPAIKIPGCGAGSVAARQFAQWGATSVLDLRRVGAAELRDRLGDHLGAKVRMTGGWTCLRIDGFVPGEGVAGGA